MRDLVFAINISLDGCCDHTKFEGTDDVLEYHTQLMREGDLLAFGRTTYQLMVPYWPDVAKSGSGTRATMEFAETFDSIQKIVFSKSLDGSECKNTRIVRTDTLDEMAKLKREQGKNILVGGVSIPSQLMHFGLIDECHFVVHPTIVGKGRRLLEGVSPPERLQLKLADAKPLQSGAVALRYRKQ